MNRVSHSYGGIILNVELKKVVLVKMQEGHWGFPKGHKDEDETEEEATRREIIEETGIEDFVELEKLPTLIRPSATDSDDLKHIHLSLFKTEQVDVSPREDDIIEAKWVSWEEIPDHITFSEQLEYADSIKEIVSKWFK